ETLEVVGRAGEPGAHGTGLAAHRQPAASNGGQRRLAAAADGAEAPATRCGADGRPAGCATREVGVPAAPAPHPSGRAEPAAPPAAAGMVGGGRRPRIRPLAPAGLRTAAEEHALRGGGVPGVPAWVPQAFARTRALHRSQHAGPAAALHLRREPGAAGGTGPGTLRVPGDAERDAAGEHPQLRALPAVAVLQTDAGATAPVGDEGLRGPSAGAR